MSRTRIIALALALLAPLAAYAADITGTWTATFDTQIGQQSYTYEFVVKGGQLTGTAKSANGSTPITEGKVDKDSISFVENLTYQGMPLKISYSGKIVSADQIEFTRDVAGVANEKLTAHRAPAAH